LAIPFRLYKGRVLDPLQVGSQTNPARNQEPQLILFTHGPFAPKVDEPKAHDLPAPFEKQ
jgi:hypothetical protein